MITRQPKIIVVGAGIAGLSSASQLAKAGFTDVLVLEASDMIGGRIHTVPFGDNPSPVELGANWIHGATLQNSTFQLAENASVLNPYRIVNRMTGRFMREVGTEIDREVVAKTWYIVKRIFVGLAKDLRNEVSKNKASISLEAVIEKNIEEELQNEFREKSTIADARKVLNAMKNYLRFHEGDELNMVSFENEYFEYEGGNIHIPGGYVQILQHLLKIIPKQSVKFQSEVIKIRWKNGIENRVEIVVKGGTQFYADHVVLTVSLGYLKRNHVSLFEPSLPAEKINAIDSIGFGRVNKIFLEFDRAITKPSYKFIAFAWDHLDIQKDKSQWYKSLFGFDQLFTRDNTVLGWISGDAAVHMETLTDQLISDTCVKLLRKFLNDDSIPDPKNILVSRWCNDPYSVGAYSFPTPNMIPGSQTTLSQPLASVPFGKPSVLFAGEATHTNHYSCTHGARDTGIREADRIIMMYTNERVNSKL